VSSESHHLNDYALLYQGSQCVLEKSFRPNPGLRLRATTSGFRVLWEASFGLWDLESTHTAQWLSGMARAICELALPGSFASRAACLWQNTTAFCWAGCSQELGAPNLLPREKWQSHRIYHGQVNKTQCRPQLCFPASALGVEQRKRFLVVSVFRKNLSAYGETR
jgi:hypothetical protein